MTTLDRPGFCDNGPMNATPETTVSDWLRRAASTLDSQLEAQLLLGHVLGRERAWLIAHGEERLDDPCQSKANALLERRQVGEPIAYLLGEREFWSRPFRVTPEVLIPRPETELIVEKALALDLPENARVLDLGTGSGCIGLTLAAERPGWQVTATDISQAALAIARQNSEDLDVGPVELLSGCWFEPLEGRRFDLIVSNPPYVAAGDIHLGKGDVRFEPESALVAGPDGLDDLRHIVDGTAAHLNPGGWLMVEIGHDQGPAGGTLLKSAGFENISILSDGAGNDRVATGQRNDGA